MRWEIWICYLYMILTIYAEDRFMKTTISDSLPDEVKRHSLPMLLLYNMPRGTSCNNVIQTIHVFVFPHNSHHIIPNLFSPHSYSKTVYCIIRICNLTKRRSRSRGWAASLYIITHLWWGEGEAGTIMRSAKLFTFSLFSTIWAIGRYNHL